MKRFYKIIIPIIVLLIAVICITTYSNKNVVKTISSEHQLYKLYNNERSSSMNLFEYVITLPFSLISGGYTGEYSMNQGGRKTIDYTMDDAEISVKTPSSTTNDYSKTNIQVEGVDEADIIKTDGKYIYSISKNNVVITNAIDPNDTFIESKIYIGPDVPNDMILYKNYLVIFGYSRSGNSWSSNNTLVDIYDVSNKKNPKSVKSFELHEPYYTSRCIDGNLYVFSNGYLRESNGKVDRKYIEDSVTKEIALNDIKYLKNNRTDMQTLIAHLDLNNLKDVDIKSYLIDISNAYVSKDNVYLLSEKYNDDKINPWHLFTFKGLIGFFNEALDYAYDYDMTTNIYKFKINKDKGVELFATTYVLGETINQYSMDEKDDHLRIALETSEGTRIEILDEKLNYIGQTESVEEDEEMYASRFIGDRAYLVTYRNTDPLFVIDLSDEENPKVMGELKIPGYSTYLHPYDENHLIGIGMDTEEIPNRDSQGRVVSTSVRTNGMKMCLFDVSDITNPKEISKTTIGDSRTVSAILTNPKALLFSKEKNLLAIPVNNYSEDFSVEYSDEYDEQISYFTKYNKKYISEGYFVYNLDLENGFNLKGIINHEKEENNNYYYYGNSKLLRGVYINNNLYTASEGYIKVNSLDDLKEISSIDISKGVKNEK